MYYFIIIIIIFIIIMISRYGININIILMETFQMLKTLQGLKEYLKREFLFFIVENILFKEID